MTDGSTKSGGKNSREDQRRSRLGAALRSNLKRRKAQVRGRADEPSSDDRRPLLLETPDPAPAPKSVPPERP